MLLRRRGVVIPLVAIFVLLPLLQSMPAAAFKPYTHNFTGDQAWEDVTADGKVTINGSEYTVDPRIVTALQNNRAFYNAGVVGPDGFPDLTFGQAIIHPENSGAWLQHIYTSAWEAQSDPSYSSAEKQQILAFAYGYLTHAAGDMWAHTLVNQFALGVFPAVGDVLTDVDKAEIAIRHIIIEGYIGDATAGYDGNPDRGPAPNGDISDDSTHGIPFDAPHRFIYETLIDPNAPTPTADRGPILDFFINLRNTLAAQVSSDPDPLADAVAAYNDTKSALESVESACNFGVGISDPAEAAADAVSDLVECPAALAEVGFNAIVDSFEAFTQLVSDSLAAAADAVFDAYLNAWVQDIDRGLRNWSKLGLATTKALFDPQAYRDTQNDACKFEGAEDSQLRIDCENGISQLDVLFHEADPFINEYLLSMLGAPDFVGGLRQLLQDFSSELDGILAVLGIPFNPIEEALAELENLAKEYVKDLIKEAYGVDVDQLKSFLSHPTYWLNVEGTTLTLPGMGEVSLNLFQSDDHEQLDAILGLTGDHHVPSAFPPGVSSSRLSDDAVFAVDGFAPAKNTITTAKLLLLGGPELNRAMGDVLVAEERIQSANLVQTYPATGSNGIATNIMLQPLTGGSPWLQSIDSGHAWRANGLPAFCDEGSPLCDAFPGINPIVRPAALNGGSGQFPVWESCLLRPAFRGLYNDWENGDQEFPALGDAPSPDPSDPNAPVSTLTVSGTTYVDGDGTTFVAADHTFTLSATDQVFTANQLNMQYRYYADGTTPGDWQPLENGGTFSIPADAGDGIWHIDFRAEDPCHTFAVEGTDADVLPPETVQTLTFVLDTTAPVITITTPSEGSVFDTDDLSSIEYTTEDGALGSGVASDAVTFDGAPATNGQTLDMFFLAPGVHTIEVTAADNLGNDSNLVRTFEIHATADSLSSNLDRALELGLISKRGIYNGLTAKIEAAQKKHERGQHEVEWNVLGAFVNQLQAQRGKSIDPATADRFISYAQDLISRGG